ncbi:hypothetical protein HDU78_008924 [Chytriomyces hyalinus]|nr:hypothetical protein HDU78_008924 [Chytriomyces hyalinus]
MPIREDRDRGTAKEREKDVLSRAVHAYLTECTISQSRASQSTLANTSSTAAGPSVLHYEYIHRIVLATTAPAATVHLSLLFTHLMLNALAQRDASLLSAFVTPAANEKITSKLMSLWSLAIILADTAWNDNAFAATSWAQVTVFKVAKAVAVWKAWAGDLLSWDLSVRDDQFVAFLEGRSDSVWKACCDANPDIASQNRALLATISERNANIAHELSRTQLHPTWTSDYHNHQLQQQQQRQFEQLQIEQQSRLHQQKRVDSYDSLYSAANNSRTATPQLRIYPTPPSNNTHMLFPQRLSSLHGSSSSLHLGTRKSLPVLQQHANASAAKVLLRNRNSRQTFPEFYPTPQNAPIPGASQQQLPMNSSTNRASMPRLGMSAARAQQQQQASNSELAQGKGRGAWTSASTENLKAATPTLFVNDTPVSSGSVSRHGSSASLRDFDRTSWVGVQSLPQQAFRSRQHEGIEFEREGGSFVEGAVGEELSTSFSEMRILGGSGAGAHEVQPQHRRQPRREESIEFMYGEFDRRSGAERRQEKSGGPLRSLWKDGWSSGGRDDATGGRTSVQQDYQQSYVTQNGYMSQQQSLDGLDHQQMHRSSKYGEYIAGGAQYSGSHQHNTNGSTLKLKNGFSAGLVSGGGNTNGTGRVGAWMGSRVWGSGN